MRPCCIAGSSAALHGTQGASESSCPLDSDWQESRTYAASEDHDETRFEPAAPAVQRCPPDIRARLSRPGARDTRPVAIVDAGPARIAAHSSGVRGRCQVELSTPALAGAVL